MSCLEHSHIQWVADQIAMNICYEVTRCKRFKVLDRELIFMLTVRNSTLPPIIIKLLFRCYIVYFLVKPLKINFSTCLILNFMKRGSLTTSKTVHLEAIFCESASFVKYHNTHSPTYIDPWRRNTEYSLLS